MHHSRSVLLTTLAAATLVGLARRALLVVRVDGRSMEPTFSSGDAVLAVRRRLRLAVRRDDLVVCRLPAGVAGPDSYLVKRVAAVGGDPVPSTDGGVVPDGHVFVRGDGARSLDSRVFGSIPVDHVVGRVVARLTRPAR